MPKGLTNTFLSVMIAIMTFVTLSCLTLGAWFAIFLSQGVR